MASPAPAPPTVRDSAAGVGLVALGILALGLGAQFVRWRSARAQKPTRIYDMDDRWFETRVFIEDEDVSCDFTMRLTFDELSSRDLVLESIARAAFEATEMPFNFSTARLERLDKLGNPSTVRTNADCKHLRGAASIRVIRSAGDPRSASEAKQQLLLSPHDDAYVEPEGEDEADAGTPMLLGQF